MTETSDAPMTTTLEDYLVAIFKLEMANGVARSSEQIWGQYICYARLTDILSPDFTQISDLQSISLLLYPEFARAMSPNSRMYRALRIPVIINN